MEEQLYQYLNRIRQIDRIIEEPVKGMIGLIWDPEAEKMLPIQFDRWIAEQGRPRTGKSRTTSCLCAATLQRIWQVRRRFVWMKEDRLKDLGARIQSRLDPGENGNPGRRFEKLVDSLSSNTFGPLNPLTAAQVFRVLLDQGEGDTHGELGFLAFFTMVWSLERRYPDELARGASLGPWGPNAYATAKCLLPIASVSRVCSLRVRFLEELARLTKKLTDAASKPDAYGRWQFASICDQLNKELFALSSLSISPDEVRASAASFANLGGEISARDEWSEESARKKLEMALLELEGVIRSIASRSKTVASEVEKMFGQIKDQILKPLGKAQSSWKRMKDLPDDSRQGVWGELSKRVWEEWLHWGRHPKYLADLLASGKRALATCEQALSKLKEVSKAAISEETGQTLQARSKNIGSIFEAMARSYKATKKVIDDIVQDDARWCRGVMERQIAHVSAGNYTEFDAAELVSAIAVAVRWGQINTPLQVRDAVSKALAGAREDGSWSPGRPFFPRDDAVGAWALTSDLVSTLTNAIRWHPDVDVADAALMRYVDWLERTRIQLSLDSGPVTGWASDRSPSHERIDLWATAFAIDALLAIRDLLEYRLWQLCEKRFTVISKVTRLSDIDPVDLGLEHKDRLHRRLYQMARDTQGKDFARGQYSLVLHGPPGSSKTKVAEAISDEMWTSSLRWGKKREPRLVRVTPADFTRGGEDRIDFEARIIFDLLRHLRGVTIFFDEIDDLLRKRDPGRVPLFIDLVIPGMLNRLQDLRDACPRQEICFLIATNYIEKIEPALIRKGRIDEAVPVTYPDAESRRMMVFRHAWTRRARALEKPWRERFCEKGVPFADKAGGWPWTALDSLLGNVRRELLEIQDKDDPNTVDVEEIFNRERRQLASTFSKPEYRLRYRDVLGHPNLRVEFATHLKTAGAWTSQANGSGAEAFAQEAFACLGGPDWPSVNGSPGLTAESREVVEFTAWIKELATGWSIERGSGPSKAEPLPPGDQ